MANRTPGPLPPDLLRIIVWMVFAITICSALGMIALAVFASESDGVKSAQAQLSNVLSLSLGGLLGLIGGSAGFNNR